MEIEELDETYTVTFDVPKVAFEEFVGEKKVSAHRWDARLETTVITDHPIGFEEWKERYYEEFEDSIKEFVEQKLLV